MSPLHKYWRGHVPLSHRNRRPWTVAPIVLTDQYVSSCSDNYFPCFRHRLVFYVFHDFVLIKQSIATEQKTALVELPFGRDKLRRIIFGIHGGWVDVGGFPTRRKQHGISKLAQVGQIGNNCRSVLKYLHSIWKNLIDIQLLHGFSILLSQYYYFLFYIKSERVNMMKMMMITMNESWLHWLFFACAV